MHKPVIAITMGDPTGIGPEIIAKALCNEAITGICRPVVIGDEDSLIRGIAATGVRLDVRPLLGREIPDNMETGICYLRTLGKLSSGDRIIGSPTVATGNAMFNYLNEAVRMCLFGQAEGIVTAPINKEAMNKAGHLYPGHTEALAELTGTGDVVMMLAGDKLRVALVTIHEPLNRVPSLITYERVLKTIQITHNDLHRYFIRNPRIAVSALNPHCGEGGLFGAEEDVVIIPAVKAAQSAGIDVVGPLSADTLFHFAAEGRYDAVIAMYHDQGLIPLKLLHFSSGVNVTLGLPIIRTSVDHGTAYELAGTGNASAESLCAAIIMAVEMALVKEHDA
jgi:4-phospho-D-threonate 3-dehydrogenase / 4-phospho-D-erythronate 3-dehydrogenase